MHNLKRRVKFDLEQISLGLFFTEELSGLFRGFTEERSLLETIFVSALVSHTAPL
jgi:hypothetical protein